MDKEVYWSGIEYEYGEKHADYPKLKGGFVYVFLRTNDVRTFLQAIEDEFKMKNLNILKVEFVNVYDPTMEWSTERESKWYNKMSNDASSSLKVIFDDFYAYES